MRRHSIVSLQILRAYAALSVVFHHVFVELNAQLPGISWIYNEKISLRGQSGVDIFFVISGFIMLYTHTGDRSGWNSGKDFLVKRIKRIYPVYWVWTTVYVAIWASGRAMKSLDPSLGHIVASYLLIPSYSHGLWGPIVGAGWTLSYEMYFYIVFAFCLVMLSRHLVTSVTIIIAALFFFCGMFGTNFATFVPSTSIVFEFVFGMIIAKIYITTHARDNFKLGIALMVIGLIATFIPDPDSIMDQRFIYYGIPSALVLLGACYTNGRIWEKMRLARFLGDGSYSIYLSHGLAITIFGTLVKHGSFKAVNPNVLAIIAFFVITAVCSLTYPLIEKPIIARLSRRKSSKSTLSVADR